MDLRCRLAVILALSLGGCAKQADLPDIVVHAASSDDFTGFRAELGTRFRPEQLKDFDTATQELQLDAMNRDIPTAAGREADMLRVVNGRTVHAVTVLGWQARKARFGREAAEMQQLLDRDLELQAKATANGPSESVTSRIGSEREVLEKLHRDRAETDRRLAEWSRGNAKP